MSDYLEVWLVVPERYAILHSPPFAALDVGWRERPRFALFSPPSPTDPSVEA